MSARLIKNGEAQAYTPFAIQTIGEPAAPSSKEPVPFKFKSPTSQLPPHPPVQAGQAAPGEAERHAPVSPAIEDPGPEREAILREAREEADRIVRAAESRVAEVERAARDRGMAEAESQIQARVERAVEEYRERLSVSLEELMRLRSEIAAEVEHDLVRLALEIARKIVHREVTVDRDVALTLARVALGRLHSRAAATVRLHPNDYAYAFEHRERLSIDAAVEIIEDRTVSPGGCIVVSDHGEIDARIEQQFAEIERDFLGGARGRVM